MSYKTPIQWCDSTVNPIMGCAGCELFLPVNDVLREIDQSVEKAIGEPFSCRDEFEVMLERNLAGMKASERAVFTPHLKLDTVHVCHLAPGFLGLLELTLSADCTPEVTKTAVAAADHAIRRSVTCYAAKLHNNKGLKVTTPALSPHKGHAKRFLTVTKFSGRMETAARWSDLIGSENPGKPWRNELPRMIFVSDMGDALSHDEDLPFLKSEVLPAIESERGRRHLWLWLTKQPARMAKLSREIDGGLPKNVCAMTTVTSIKTLPRVDILRKVEATMRGLSIEPLRERIPPDKLDLTGIDWVIVGGESGDKETARSFAIEWAEEIRDHCRKHGVAFFLKQLGRNPTRGGEAVKLANSHGGDWAEWDEHLRVRKFPQAFHDYRKSPTLPVSPAKHILSVSTSVAVIEIEDPVARKNEFDRLNRIVETGVKAYWEAGRALAEIQYKDLWKEGGHATWEAYCRLVAGISRIHAHRIIRAAEFVTDLELLPDGNIVIPKTEAQVRPLWKLKEPEKRIEAWTCSVREAEGQPTAPQVIRCIEQMLHPDSKTAEPESRVRQQRMVIGELKAAILNRKSWEELETLINRLDGLLAKTSGEQAGAPGISD